MSNSGTARRLLAAAALAILCTAITTSARGPEAAPANETRALWVLRTSLTSPQSIDGLVKRARDNGRNGQSKVPCRANETSCRARRPVIRGRHGMAERSGCRRKCHKQQAYDDFRNLVSFVAQSGRPADKIANHA